MNILTFADIDDIFKENPGTNAEDKKDLKSNTHLNSSSVKGKRHYSTSARRLSREPKEPNNSSIPYSKDVIEFLKKNKVDRVVVFVRNPIKRVISGLATQMVTYGISQQAIEKMTNNTFGIIDSHTIPQFWFLMAAAKELDCKFDIRPMDMLNLVDCNIQQLNKSPSHNIGLSDATLTQLNHFYTEDIVLFNQFQNSTATIEEIRTKILLEKNFIDDLNQYKECLTFYFETQLH